MKIGTETGSLTNHLYSQMVGCPQPEIGMTNERRTKKMQNAKHFFLKDPASALDELIELRVPINFAMLAFGPSLAVAAADKSMIWDAQSYSAQFLADDDAARAQAAKRAAIKQRKEVKHAVESAS